METLTHVPRLNFHTSLLELVTFAQGNEEPGSAA